MKSNVVPKPQKVHVDTLGENYAFDGCARLVMDNLGETDYDYSFFAGLTGDNFAQFWPYGGLRGMSATDFLMNKTYAEGLFAEIGYAAELATERRIAADKALYALKLTESVDRGVPVIQFGGEGWFNWHVIVGYEDGGETVLRLQHEDAEPTRFPLADVNRDDYAWIFVGEKTARKDLAKLYRDAILRLPELLTTKTADYCFGAQAFREWANAVERGEIFKGGLTDDNRWWDYTNYVCNFETNAYCNREFLRKAKELNPDMTFTDSVAELYKPMSTELGGGLEHLGGGFNVTEEAMQDPSKAKPIAEKLRGFADNVDEVVGLIKDWRSR